MGRRKKRESVFVRQLGNGFLLSVVLLASLYLFTNRSKSLFRFFTHAGSGTTYYVSSTGNDSSSGTVDYPFKTIGHAVSILQPGNTLIVQAGTYPERITVSATGTSSDPITIRGADNQKVIIDGSSKASPTVDLTGSYLVFSGFDVRNSPNTCVNVGGTYNTVQSLMVTGCISHGIQASGQHIKINNNVVTGTILENKSRSSSSGWGSALKARDGSDDVEFADNIAFNNYGEGIAVTMGKNVTVKNNLFYDNFSVNIYVDNSINTKVFNNISSCTDTTEYLRNGSRATGIALGEESYPGWGAQLANIEIYNNLVGYCGTGIAYFGADVAGGGLDNVKIMNNTFWGGTKGAIYLPEETTKQRNTVVANNIFHNDGSKDLCWVDSRNGIDMHNNFWVNAVPGSWTNCQGSSDKSGDVKLGQTPQYNNATTFKLSASSGAIDAATSELAKADYFGISRPQGSAADIGACEYSSSSPTPTPSPTPLPTPTPQPTIMPTPTPVANALPIITTSSLTAARLNRNYSKNVTGTDINKTDILNLSATNLPSGFQLTNCQQTILRVKTSITCKLTGKSAQLGTYPILFTISDNHGGSIQKTITLKVIK